MLLKNERATLPLKAGAKIAIVGPHANASRFLIQVDTGKICGGALEHTNNVLELRRRLFCCARQLFV